MRTKGRLALSEAPFFDLLCANTNALFAFFGGPGASGVFIAIGAPGDRLLARFLDLELLAQFMPTGQALGAQVAGVQGGLDRAARLASVGAVAELTGDIQRLDVVEGLDGFVLLGP